MDFEAVERVQLGHFKEMKGWHQMLETGVRGKSYMPLWMNYKRYWVTSKKSSECQRLIANMKKQKDGYSILSCPCWQIWLQGCDDLFRWHRYLWNVTHVSIQDKCHFNRTIWNKIWWGLLTLQSCGHYWYLGKPIFHWPQDVTQHFFGSQEDNHFPLLDQQ